MSPGHFYEDPVAAYDAIAPVYPDIAHRRRHYLHRVDEIIGNQLRAVNASSILDIGAGTGDRTLRIAQSASVDRVTIVEPGSRILPACPSNADLSRIRAEDLRQLTGQFDAVLCLWNVIGHIFPASARIDALREMARLAGPGGTIFIDVNNRYNARQYGLLRTFSRALFDRMRPSDSNGDVRVSWSVNGEPVISRGHVFTDREFQKLAAQAGLEIVARWSIDYDTGEIVDSSWSGNLLYRLKP